MTSPLTGDSVALSKSDSAGRATGALLFRNVRLTAVSVFITLCSVVTAYHLVFTRQNLTSYDDEGTLMIIIRRFLEGHVLYDDIVVYYGPFYYLYEWCAHVLTGTPVSHDSVRFVSMFFWVTCALLVYWLVYRATNSLLLAAAAHFFHSASSGSSGKIRHTPRNSVSRCSWVLLWPPAGSRAESV